MATMEHSEPQQPRHEFDFEEVVKMLSNRIAQLELENAMLRSALVKATS